MYRRRPPTLSASTGIVSILVLPRYCCSSVGDKLSSPPPDLPLPLLSVLPKLSKKFVTSSQKLFACNDVRDPGETPDDATFLVRYGVEVDGDKLALSGTNAIAPAVHSESTSARSQSESSVVLRENVLVTKRRMAAHVPVFSVRTVLGREIARGFDDNRR